jgi:hypothetical protein
MVDCSGPTQEELAAAAAVAKAQADLLAAQAKAAEIAARIAATTAAEKEDDTTNITMVPVLTSSDVSVQCMGMFFNMQGGFRAEDVPATALTITKDVLDRSSGFIVGRFKADIKDRSKIVFGVTVDGVLVDGFGTNLPYVFTSGTYDTTLFKYPNTAAASTPGPHQVHVKVGLITGIVEKQLGLVVWDSVKGISEADFTITLQA